MVFFVLSFVNSTLYFVWVGIRTHDHGLLVITTNNKVTQKK